MQQLAPTTRFFNQLVDSQPVIRAYHSAANAAKTGPHFALFLTDPK
jgi:hypothetical protein